MLTRQRFRKDTRMLASEVFQEKCPFSSDNLFRILANISIQTKMNLCVVGHYTNKKMIIWNVFQYSEIEQWEQFVLQKLFFF